MSYGSVFAAFPTKLSSSPTVISLAGVLEQLMQNATAARKATMHEEICLQHSVRDKTISWS